jgi:omega-amidase
MRNAAESLSITLVQNNLAWEDKQLNLESFEEKIKGHDSKMEVVLLPEMFNTGFSMNPSVHAETMEGESVEWMKRVASENNIILAGSLMIKESSDYFNRLVWMLPNGEYGYYDKRHLFAYAGEDEHYTSGTKRLIASVKGWKVNLQVCYDLRFPVWARQVVPITAYDNDPEYDVLVYVANWPEKRVHAWKTLLQARAIENQCYVAGVNRVGDDGNGNHYTGDSMIVDALGKPLVHAGESEGVFTYVLQWSELQAVREKLPFLRDADPFIIAG